MILGDEADLLLDLFSRGDFGLDAHGCRIDQNLVRQFDNGQYDRLLLEAPPNNPSWMAIIDRLQRASCVPFIEAAQQPKYY